MSRGHPISLQSYCPRRNDFVGVTFRSHTGIRPEIYQADRRRLAGPADGPYNILLYISRHAA